MDISPGRLADNAVYYLYLADPGRHIKSGDGDPGSLLGAHKISIVPPPPSGLSTSSRFSLTLCSNEETSALSFSSLYPSSFRASSFPRASSPRKPADEDPDLGFSAAPGAEPRGGSANGTR